MKKKRKESKLFKKELKCTCCNNNVYASEIENMKSLSVSLWPNKTSKVDAEYLSSYSINTFNSENFQWACDSCLVLKKAIVANPTKQTYCDYKPYLAYFDKEIECQSCGVQFTFKKEEQLFWYEKLGFWVQSRPKNCIECRRIKRKEKSYQKRIEELNSKSELLNLEELNELAQIYDYIGNEAKRNMYLNKIKKAYT